MLQILYIGPLGVAHVLLTTSVVYFIAGRQQPLRKRLLKSCHGIIFICVMFPVAVKYLSIFDSAAWLSYPFWVLPVLGAAAAANSLLDYSRSRSLPFLHVFTIIYGALAVLYGMSTLP
jgi:hypothetical protein